MLYVLMKLAVNHLSNAFSSTLLSTITLLSLSLSSEQDTKLRATIYNNVYKKYLFIVLQVKLSFTRIRLHACVTHTKWYLNGPPRIIYGQLVFYAGRVTRDVNGTPWYDDTVALNVKPAQSHVHCFYATEAQ